MKLKGGRPKKKTKVINVAKYMPQIKNVAKRQLIIGQLDRLKDMNGNITGVEERAKLIEQIKKDFLLVI